jgi:predicted nucleic acid-binding protein
MIAADTSTLVAFLAGHRGDDIEALDHALTGGSLYLPPVVVTELLSDPRARRRLEPILRDMPLLTPTEGFWQRAGQTRALVLARRLRAPLADTLICQSCLDYDAALITRDKGFGPFARLCGLRLI